MGLSNTPRGWFSRFPHFRLRTLHRRRRHVAPIAAIEQLEPRLYLSITSGPHPNPEFEFYPNQFGNTNINLAIDSIGDHDTIRVYFKNSGNATFFTSSGLDLEMGFWNDRDTYFQEFFQNPNRDAFSDNVRGTQPEINANVTSEAPLALVIGEVGDNATGPYTLHIRGPSASPKLLPFTGSVATATGAQRPPGFGFDDVRIYNNQGANFGAQDHEFIQFIAPRTGVHTIQVAPSNDNTLDATFILFDDAGNSLLGDTVRPINDNGVGGAETRQIQLTGGQRYTVRIDGFGQTEGFFDINIAAPLPADQPGVFRNGVWILENNANKQLDSGDIVFSYGQPGDVPITGDWNGDGFDEVGVFRDGFWYLDLNGNRRADGMDAAFGYGVPGDIPVSGDWNRDGRDEIGVFRGGTWFLDSNGSRQSDAGDETVVYGTQNTQPVVINDDIARKDGVQWRLRNGQTFATYDVPIPVVGDWTGDGLDDVGGVNNGRWLLDLNGNRRAFSDIDEQLTFMFGEANDRPLAGIWNPNPPGFGVTGADAGAGPHVRVFDTSTGAERFGLLAYAPSFTGGVRVAAGDVTGDGVPDVITAPGPGGGPHIRVFNGVNGAEVLNFFAYNPGFAGGVFVASGDINGDGRADIITGPDSGGGPHVRVFSGINGAEIGGFFAYDPRFLGGVRVAAGDVNGDGRTDIITGAGPGGGPSVRVWSGVNFSNIQNVFAFSPGFFGGVYIASGDLNGDGRADIVVGAGAGGGPNVRAISGMDGGGLLNFFAYNPAFRGGVRVAAGDLDFDGRADVQTAAGPGAGPHVRGFRGSDGADYGGFFPYPGFTGGLFIAGNSPSPRGGSPLSAFGGGFASGGATLTEKELQPVVTAAVERFQSAGLSDLRLSQLQSVNFAVAELEGNRLGLSQSGRILIDINAGGRGWFVDPTPLDDLEFRMAAGQLTAINSEARAGVDLLTVVLHELGHQLGFLDLNWHETSHDLMESTLSVGIRRLPPRWELDQAFADGSFLNALTEEGN